MIKREMDKDNKEKGFDLEQRTLLFSKKCIVLCKSVESSLVNRVLVSQLIRSACSVGANYREANESGSKNEFYHRISLCRREAKETEYWLELISFSDIVKGINISDLQGECRQLVKIFVAIYKTKNK
jgi:four helix bundle protein